MNEKLKKILELVFIILMSFVFIPIGIFTHEIFHLAMAIYFGVDKASFYTDYNSGYVKYEWSNNNITKEEGLIISMAGSVFNIILYLIIMLYLYSIRKRLAFILLPTITFNIWVWTDNKSDCQDFFKYNPTINYEFVNNLFFGLLILAYILIFLLIVFIVFSLLNEIKYPDKRTKRRSKEKRNNDIYI